MCKFCVEHGEGKRWYLNAENYSHDLSSDLRRREYMVDFIAGFSRMRKNAYGWMDRLDRIPAPLGRTGKNLISRYMRSNHFGQPIPLEDCEGVLNLATSITAIPCICRMHTLGQKASEVCILVTTQPIEPVLAEGFADYANGPDLDDFHAISVEEAMRLLRECEAVGLMHSIWTFQTPFTAAICNCNLESGCMAMNLNENRGLKTMWRGEMIAQLDETECTRCGRCVRVCPFSAIDKPTRTLPAIVHAERCWGCGICRPACPTGALSLVDRRTVPGVAVLW